MFDVVTADDFQATLPIAFALGPTFFPRAFHWRPVLAWG
jgi:hypothetical protein